jgi:hypothetical protein
MFIKDLFAISPQPTYNLQLEAGNFYEHNNKYYSAIEPDYQQLIPSKILRRMGKAVRMGVGAGLPLINRNKNFDGIIIGTANGGLEDCILFLNQIVDYNEGVLTPTNFVQSTPNALAGQLSIMSCNTGYNMTHVNGSLAFENALLDAQMFLEENKKDSTLLVGAVDEISKYNYNIDFLAGRFKSKTTPNSELLTSNSKGSVCGEGATMFVVSNSSNNALSEILDVSQITTTNFEQLKHMANSLLNKHGITLGLNDLLILGKNGDKRTDSWYNLFGEQYPQTHFVYYKYLCGEYRTSSAFACYIAVQIMSGKINSLNGLAGTIPESPNYVLIYNHFDGERHGLILLKRIVVHS